MGVQRVIRPSDEGFEPGKYLSMLVRSYIPNQYAKLLEGRLRTFLAFFGIVLGTTALIFSIISLALTVRYIAGIPETLAPVHELRFSGSVVADAPVVLLDRPHVVLDATVNGSDSAVSPRPDLLFTMGGVVYPRYLYAGESFIAWSDLNDLKRESALRDRLLGGILLFLAPSIIFWGLVYFLGRILLISLLLLLLGYWIPRLFKSRIGGKENLKLLLLTLPSALLLGVGFAPLAPRPLFWWGLGLTVGLYALGVAMISERDATDWTKRDPHRSR